MFRGLSDRLAGLSLKKVAIATAATLGPALLYIAATKGTEETLSNMAEEATAIVRRLRGTEEEVAGIGETSNSTERRLGDMPRGCDKVKPSLCNENDDGELEYDREWSENVLAAHVESCVESQFNFTVQTNCKESRQSQDDDFQKKMHQRVCLENLIKALWEKEGACYSNRELQDCVLKEQFPQSVNPEDEFGCDRDTSSASALAISMWNSVNLITALIAVKFLGDN